MKKITVYTDGACSGNPGAGGYAAILTYGDREKVITGGEAQTTNNRMELSAVIAALSALKERCEVTVYSDSSYIVDAINKGWLEKWQRMGWKKSDKSPVLNRDLWESLVELLPRHEITFVWVRGHNGNEYNERCDVLAVAESHKFL